MENITDGVRIIGLLKRLLESRALMTIQINGQEQDFTTAVIKVSGDEETLYLDELKPEKGHELLKATPSFKAKAYIDGVYVAFNGTVEIFSEQDGIPYYKLPIPTSMDYHQRRASVRISLSAAHPVPVLLRSENGKEVYEGTIADLSLGGLRIRFTENLPEHIKAGQKYICELKLPPDNKETFCSEYFVRAVRHQVEGSQSAFIGGQFFGLSKTSERQIQKTVMFLQRLAQQKRNN